MNIEVKSIIREVISLSDDKIICIRFSFYKMNVIIILFRKLFYLGEVILRVYKVF